MFLWTLFIVVAFVMVFLHDLAIPFLPPNLYLLMGVNFTTSVLSTAIALRRDMPKGNSGPHFMRDIFFPAGDSLDLPRTQMFIWTIVSLGVFAVLFYESWIAGKPSLPDISSGLVALMGLSNGAYLGVKAAAPAKKM
jgi:hypothetical protein